MEDSERDIIRKKLPGLIETTTTSAVFLAIFETNVILTMEEVDSLRVVERNEGHSSASAKFYEIIITRKGAFKILLDALLQTNQSGAYSILVREPQSIEHEAHGNSSIEEVPQNERQTYTPPKYDVETLENASNKVDSPIFKRSHPVLESFLSNTQTSFLLIGTLDSILTVHKIRDSAFMRDIHVEEIKLWNSFKLFFSGLPKKNLTHENKAPLMVFHDNNQKDPAGKYSTTKKAIRFLRMVKDVKNVKTVIVLKEDLEALHGYVSTCFKHSEHVEVSLDTFSWNDLTHRWQNKLLTRDILDQANQKSLQKFCSSFKYEDQNKFQETFLKGQLLVDLINYKELPNLFRQTIPPVCHYVNRRLRSRFNLSSSIFQLNTQNDIFVLENFTNIDEVKHLAKPCYKKIDTAGNQLVEGTITATYILSEYQNDFKVICKRCPENTAVHNIRQSNGSLVWQQTVGIGIQTLQSCVCSDKLQIQIPEDAIFDLLETRKEKESFIISDSPGMGKSVLLAKLARKTKARYPIETFVFYFVMTDFIVSIIKQNKERGESPNMLDIIIKEEIIRNCSNYELNSSILTAKESPPLYIFFDGLDELPSDSVDLALTCFHRIKALFSRARIHVTTRPHLRHLLERALGTLGYNIEPFNRPDQVDFLTKQWSNIRHEPKLDFKKLEYFAEHCLSELEKSLSQKEKSLAGIPLQCLLISEVFMGEAEEFADPENQQLVETATPRIHLNSITELYERLVNRKLLAYQRTYLKPDTTTTDLSALRNILTFVSIQVIMSGSVWNEKLRPTFLSEEAFTILKRMLPKWKATLAEFQAGLLPRSDILAIGLLEEIDPGHWHFIHRTFAEYLIAVFAAENYNTDSELIITFIIDAVLETVSHSTVLSTNLNLQQNSFKFKYPVICHFLNSMAKPQTHFPINSCMDKVKQACINDNFLNLYKIFVPQANKQQANGQKESILLASQTNTIEILQWIEFYKPIYHELYPTVLHIAIEHGHKSLVTYLLNDCIPDDIFQNSDIADQTLSKLRNILPDISNLLPFCVGNTSDSSEDVVTNKKDIMKFLYNFFPSTFYDDLYQNKPLLSPNIHIDLLCYIMEFVKSDELIDEKDNDERTVLFTAAEYLSVENYQRFLEILSNKHSNALKILLRLHDDFTQTPLQYIISHLDVTTDIFDLFSQNGADMCSVDATGYSTLWNAIRHKRSLHVIKTLLDCDKNQVDKYKRNELHIAAQHAMYHEITKYLLDQGYSVDDQDCFGNTPIYYSMRNQNQLTNLQFSTLLDLLKPSNLSHVNSKMETVADVAKKLKNEQAQMVLRQLGYST